MESNKQTTIIEKLPYSVTKSQLQYLYEGNLTVVDIRAGINNIIRKTRNLSPDNKVRCKKVYHNELMLFVEEFGLPEGYEL